MSSPKSGKARKVRKLWLREVSVVDEGANEFAVMTIMKRKLGENHMSEKTPAEVAAEALELVKARDATIAELQGQITSKDAELAAQAARIEEVLKMEPADREFDGMDEKVVALIKAERQRSQGLEDQVKALVEKDRGNVYSREARAEFSGLPANEDEIVKALTAIDKMEDEDSALMRRLLKAGSDTAQSLARISGDASRNVEGSPHAKYDAAIAKHRGEGKTLAEAQAAIVAEDPGLYEQMKASAN